MKPKYIFTKLREKFPVLEGLMRHQVTIQLIPGTEEMH